MRRIIYLFILLTSFLHAQTISVATGEWSPWVSKSLEDSGIGAKITKEAFKVQGIDTKFLFYPWKRTYLMAKLAKNDVSGFWLKTKDREKDFYFSDPIFSIKNKLVFKKGKSITFNSPKELKKYKIAVTRGYSYSKEIDEMIKNSELDVYVVNNDLSALKQIIKKENFDAFLCSISVSKRLIQENFSKEEQALFDYSKKEVFKKDVFLMVSKNHKDHKEILNSFNKGLNILKQNGRIEKIINSSYEVKDKN